MKKTLGFTVLFTIVFVFIVTSSIGFVDDDYLIRWKIKSGIETTNTDPDEGDKAAISEQLHIKGTPYRANHRRQPRQRVFRLQHIYRYLQSGKKSFPIFTDGVNW
jgi:hypothetical protein